VNLSLLLLVVLAVVVMVGGLTIATLVQRLRTLERQAVTDPLTGAFNRRHLDACLRTAIERRARFGESACLVMFDVDRFKDINDRLGHTAGDAVLKVLVLLTRQRTRALDLLFRTGGEEFVLLLSGTRINAALAAAEQLRAFVAASRLIDGHTISISLGVSELRDGQSPLEWLGDADRALYYAKRAGRNRVGGGSHKTSTILAGVSVARVQHSR
jgi:diguanylate cyclase